MYANLILLEPAEEEPALDEALYGRIWSGQRSERHFPCWCECRVVAEVALEDGDHGPFQAELRLTDLLTEDVSKVREWEIDGQPGPREMLAPHLYQYVIKAEMGFNDPAEAELSLWVAKASNKPLARRCIAITRTEE